MYEIVMPQLSDSMDEGKLINWKVKEGQTVMPGDVIADVESDKAIMEVQSFKNGTVQKLLVKEGDVVRIGEVIAQIATQSDEGGKSEKEPIPTVSEPKSVVKQEPKPTVKKEIKTEPEPKIPANKHHSEKDTSGISPKARAKAAQYGIDIQTILQKTASKVLHVEDVDGYLKEHYFTPKALKILDKYSLDISKFTLDHKIDAKELEDFIARTDAPLPQALSQMQKAIISNVSNSVQKPVYHLYEHIDASLFLEHDTYSITSWLIKIFSKVIMEHESFRSHLKNEALLVDANASIAIAVANEKNLYMPVVKEANKCSIIEITKQLKNFKIKLQENSFTAQDMQGSNFGISNLGMLGVEKFDAMINKEDASVAAIGSVNEGKISVTLTVDHRLVNGYEAALFMRDVKKEAKNPLNFKE